MTRFAPRAARAGLALLLALPLFASAAAAVPNGMETDLDSFSGTYLAARTADVEKDIPSAADFYRSALQSDPENPFLLERALVMSAAAGDVDDAVAFARRLREVAPDSPPARLVVAVDDLRHEKYSDAIAALDSRGAGVLADLTAGLITAWARFGEGEVDKAITDLEALQGEDWYEPFKLLHAGYIALAAGRTEEAVTKLGLARQADANAVRITEAYARALAVSGAKDAALSALKDFLTRFPDNALAMAALDDVENDRAHEISIATPVDGAAEALAGIGAAVGQEGGTEVAFLYLRLSLFLKPDIAGGLAALSLGNLLDASGQGEAAIEVYNGIPAALPFHALGQLRAALALDRMDKVEDAEAAFKEALTAKPGDVQTLISYGNMLRGRERFAEAADLYTEALGLIPSPSEADWSLYYFRGICFEQTKQWPKAEADFRKALELRPEQPLVMNYLGYSWVDMGTNLDEAMALIRKAVELRPNDGYVVDSLGWAHYRLGDYQAAVDELERAIGLRPEDPVINDHLGDAYWKAGRTLEAQFQWRHARDFGAEGDVLELILKKIAERTLIEKTKDAAAEAGGATEAPAAAGTTPRI